MHLISTHILGRVTRDIGGAHERRNVVVFRCHHHDTDRDTNCCERFLPFETVTFNRTTNCFGNFHRTIFVATFHEDAELVTTKPRKYISRSYLDLNDFR